MPHEHHNDCGHESHSHELTSDLGFQDNLFLHIDRNNAIALNASGSGSDAIKPWHARLDETQVAHKRFIVDRNILTDLTSLLNRTRTIKCRQNSFAISLLQ
jgi:hypothetical protein